MKNQNSHSSSERSAKERLLTRGITLPGADTVLRGRDGRPMLLGKGKIFFVCD